jgi:iron complex transport system permease protein
MTSAKGPLLIAAVSVCILIVAPFIGIEWLSPSVLTADRGSSDFVVFWDLRIPRVVTAFLAGATLAGAGLTFQALFRNPLATPFTLGISSGASLGAAFAVRIGIMGTLLGFADGQLFAFAGALMSIALVYGLSRLREGMSSAAMLLAGVAVSFFFSSLILFIQYTADMYDSFRMLRWVMGSLGGASYATALNILPFALAGLFYVAAHIRELDLIVAGDEWATGRGLDVRRVRRNLFIVVSLIVGAVVAQCGPIGFVGMMAPHICRLLVGPRHARLLPVSLLFGGAFLVLCDALARTILAPVELPVGIVTAFLGGPFFLVLLARTPQARAVA